jgi:hypothetical protein
MILHAFYLGDTAHRRPSKSDACGCGSLLQERVLGGNASGESAMTRATKPKMSQAGTKCTKQA